MNLRMAMLVALLCVLPASGCGGGGGMSGPGGTSSTNSPSNTGNGTAQCPIGNAIFSASPIALTSVIGWVPLGAMRPTGHTFPTDHQYLYFALQNNMAQTVNVVAPADMRIFQVYSTTGFEPGVTIFFQPCAQIMGRISMTAFSSDLAAAAGSIDQNCQSTASSTQCQKMLTYDVKAGQVVGTISAPTGGPFALDFYLWDSRVAPPHFADPAKFAFGPYSNFLETNIVAASDYYTAAMAPQIAAKLGSFDGTQQRTVAPIGGTISVDVDGTARGYWFNPAQAYPPENPHMVLGPDNVNPATTEVLSIGSSLPNKPNGFRASFAFTMSGNVNRAFESLGPDGNVYCYQAVADNTQDQTRVALVQMLDSATLKIEVLADSILTCASAQPWTFSANAFAFKR